MGKTCTERGEMDGFIELCMHELKVVWVRWQFSLYLGVIVVALLNVFFRGGINHSYVL